MTPPAEGQEKDVLLVLDKQQGKVSAVKGIDKEGNLQTVPPTTGHGGEFMQVDKNSDVFSNFISNFYRKYQDTSGLELFSVKASEAERDAKAIEDNHRNPTPEGDKRAEMLRVPKPDFHEFKQGYRFDPSKIDWENLKKVGITAGASAPEALVQGVVEMIQKEFGAQSVTTLAAAADENVAFPMPKGLWQSDLDEARSQKN